MGILDFIFKASPFGRTTVSRESEDKIRSDWERIETLMRAQGPSNLRQALITADRALDTALRDIFAGETMGERLKAAVNRFERYDYNKIWEAHKLRNNLVHESNFEPPYYVVSESINAFRKALETLGVRL